jgi:hypothetical protein
MTKNYRPSYCLHDATTDEKYIKKAISDGSLAIFDTEKEALKAKQIGNGVTEVYLLSKKDIENIEINRVAFEQQQAQIEQLLAIVHGVEDSFATYSVEFKHSDPRGSMKRLGKVIEKMALDPAISHRANKLRACAVIDAVTRVSSGACEKNHKYMIIDGEYCYLSTRALRELADKMERGEV